jgi:26S proteasome regulatory subunit N8
LKINALFERFCPYKPVFTIIDVRPGVEAIPTTAYVAVEEVEEEGKEIQQVFKHIVCNIEAEEAEEVGVEHLLRDINDPSTSHLALQIKEKVNGLKGLLTRLQEMKDYLDKVSVGTLPMNHQIIANIQNILNLLPNLNVEELVNSLLMKTNDMHLVLYVSSLIRAIIALHDLLNNKIKYKDMDAILDQNAGIGEIAGAANKKGGAVGEKGNNGDEEKKGTSTPNTPTK